MTSPIDVFITGGSGVIGRALIEGLLQKNISVDALSRPGSEKKFPAGCKVHTGDPLNAASYAAHLKPHHTFVQLVGISHPNPLKKNQFRAVDFVSASGSVEAAKKAGIQHFVYLSVAQPAPIMQSYIRVRQEIEQKIRDSGMNATIVRPWYVLGPGRRWPMLIQPLYWLLERFEKTRSSAQRLGFVSLDQMTAALVNAVKTPPHGIRVWEVPDIRREGNQQ